MTTDDVEEEQRADAPEAGVGGDRATATGEVPTLGFELDAATVAGLVDDLTAGGFSVRLVVRGGSMSPWIRDGDTVTLTRSTPRLGEVAAFRRLGLGRMTVHRLTGRVGRDWVARGDRLRTPDGVVASGEILGIVTRVERGGREAFLPRGLTGLLLAQLSRLALESGMGRWRRR